jgi:hypothetical protein
MSEHLLCAVKCSLLAALSHSQSTETHFAFKKTSFPTGFPDAPRVVWRSRSSAKVLEEIVKLDIEGELVELSLHHAKFVVMTAQQSHLAAGMRRCVYVASLRNCVIRLTPLNGYRHLDKNDGGAASLDVHDRSKLYKDAKRGVYTWIIVS